MKLNMRTFNGKTTMKKSMLKARTRSRSALFALLTAPAALALACGDEIKNDYYTDNYYGDGGADADPKPGHAGKAPVHRGGEGGDDAGSAGAAGATEGGSGGDGGSGGEPSLIDPRYPDAPVMDTPVSELELKLFDTVGTRFWFGVSDEQRQKMNDERFGGGGPIFNGGIYTPGGGNSNAYYVDHLWVTTPGDGPHTTDFGKVQARVVGQSTYFPWDSSNIPNINIDADEFVKKQRIGGFEHLRFGNGQISNIFRERVTSELYHALHYPAPLTTFAWVSSNVWGPGVSIPYTLIERYKRAFCDRYADEFGGGCVNMWEFYGGDFNQGGMGGPKGGGGNGIFDQPDSCQIDECETSRVHEFEDLLSETSTGPGFKAATAAYVDWPAFHRFQCLSWAFSSGDDALHNSNNIVIVERADGKFQYLPYSIDISLGMEWYPYTQLPGENTLARGCQADPDCWADTIAECEQVIKELNVIEPNKILKKVYDELKDNDMLRAGDEGRYEFLDNWLTEKVAGLPDDLENYRNDPSACPKGTHDCGGWCDYICPGECIPPGKDPIPLDADMGVAGSMAMGGAPGVGGTMGVGGGIVPGGEAGAPNECPKIELYPAR